MKIYRRIATALTILSVLGCTGSDSSVAIDGGSMIIHGGTVYTGPDQTPEPGKAILVRDGRIVSIGTKDILFAEAPGARLVDASGKTVLPGLIDSHAHIDGLATAMAIVDLVDTTSFEDVLDRLDARQASAAPGEWIVGHGWDQNDWDVQEFPTATMADQRISENPLWLGRIDGHAGLANTAAMKIAGIDASTPDPPGGRIVRDASGTPTGLFIDDAKELVTNSMPDPSREVRKQRMIDALNYISSQGLTAVHEAGSVRPGELIEIYRELAEDGKLPIRVYYMIPDIEPLFEAWFENGPLINFKDRLTVRSIKIYADGALGSRGAALLAPYDDDPENTGIMTTSGEHIDHVAQQARKAGFQVCTHAIGDRGTRTALDAYESAGVTPADRYRIEHFQIVAPADIERAARMGIIAAMQPTHATSDMPWAEARVGAERLRGGYAWRSVLDASGHLALGSDFPVESVNPFFGIYSAVTRQDHDGNPPGGWTPSERLSLAEALRGFTIDSAYASFEQDRLGTIEPGKAADFTIIDGALPDMPDSDLWKAAVSMTIVGGEIVYERR